MIFLFDLSSKIIEWFVGNKVDLLPPDSEPGFLKHYRSSLEKAIRDAGIASQFNILKYVMVSAKTGFGVEDLISVSSSHFIPPYILYLRHCCELILKSWFCTYVCAINPILCL